MLLIGIDGGASHTEAVAGLHPDQPLARWRGGPGAARPGNEAAAASHLVIAVRAVLEQAGHVEPPYAVLAGLAGAGREAVRMRIRELALKELGEQTALEVTTDGTIALQAAFGEQPGIVVCAGSGSIAYARDAKGEVWRVGGLGWRIGDEGSGYALARSALAAVGKTLEGRGPDTALTQRLSRAVGAESPAELASWSLSASPARIAALAHEVARVATEGDHVAGELVHHVAKDLATLIEALLPRLEAHDNPPVALAGGLLAEGSAVRGALIGLLRQAHPHLAISADPVDPAVGALQLAAQLV